MAVDDFGAEQTNSEDRAYRGSRYMEVRDALFANPYRKIWGGQGDSALPVFPVTLGSVLHGMWSRRRYFFLQAAERTGRASRRRADPTGRDRSPRSVGRAPDARGSHVAAAHAPCHNKLAGLAGKGSCQTSISASETSVRARTD